MSNRDQQAAQKFWRGVDRVLTSRDELRDRHAALLAALDALREKFDACTIAEINKHNGIPALPIEELALREAIAVVLEELATHREPR